MHEEFFTLYVTGTSDLSRKALECVNNYLGSHKNRNTSLNVIDITTSHESALAEKIFTTPTLIWKSAGRKLRFVGDFSNLDQYLA